VSLADESHDGFDEKVACDKSLVQMDTEHDFDQVMFHDALTLFSFLADAFRELDEIMNRVCTSLLVASHCLLPISQLPKLCVKISILRHRRMWVRSFSTRLTSVTFAEDKVLIFLILRKNAKIVQL